jgi:2'-5' RNA ligase
VAEEFHQGGRHVQKAHGRRTTQLAADGEHLSGGMIALMPTAADTKRLALPGGEAAADLHVTLAFLGDDGAAIDDHTQGHLEEAVRLAVAGMGPLTVNLFGVAHWNGKSDGASWVWNTGDMKPPTEGVPSLEEMHEAVWAALELTEMEPPDQHCPWVPHICAAYTGDLTLVRELEKRLGPVTLDRVRLSFGARDVDIPLAGALTAGAYRREPEEHEVFTDFAEHNRQWEGSVATASNRLAAVLTEWRSQIREQVASGMDTPEELASLSVDSGPAVDIISEAMHSLAQRAGDALAREALYQGVKIPEWSLPDDTVTAAVGGRRLLRSVAQMTSDLLASNMVQSAKRLTLGLLTRQQDPATLASEVDRTLQEGQESALRGPLGTAMSTAQTAGRQAVLEAAPPGEYYASEILDKNTCAPCRAVDGEQFGDLERAIKAYPVMGYKDCVGPRYGNSCRGLIVARWRPEETGAQTAAGGVEPFHGTKGQPGYGLLHGDGKLKNKNILSPNQEGILHEDLDNAHFAGFIDHPYSYFTDPGSHFYDPEDEKPDDEINYVHWEHLGRYYASGAGGTWYSDFEGSRRIRTAANESAGLDQTGHDRLLAEAGELDDHDRVVGTSMLAALAVSPPLDRPLYRGSYYAGANPDEVEAQLRGSDGLDFSVASFTDGQGVADYFADPGFYQTNHPDGPQGGTQVMYEVEPGAQGILGHIFQKDMKAGDPGQDPDEIDYVESTEANTDWTQGHPREIVTGGHFEVGEIVRDGDRITVRLRQTKVFKPKGQT